MFTFETLTPMSEPVELPILLESNATNKILIHPCSPTDESSSNLKHPSPIDLPLGVTKRRKYDRNLHFLDDSVTKALETNCLIFPSIGDDDDDTSYEDNRENRKLPPFQAPRGFQLRPRPSPDTRESVSSKLHSKLFIPLDDEEESGNDNSSPTFLGNFLPLEDCSTPRSVVTVTKPHALRDDCWTRTRGKISGPIKSTVALSASLYSAFATAV